MPRPAHHRITCRDIQVLGNVSGRIDRAQIDQGARGSSPDFLISSAKLLPPLPPYGIRRTRLTVGIS